MAARNRTIFAQAALMGSLRRLMAAAAESAESAKSDDAPSGAPDAEPPTHADLERDPSTYVCCIWSGMAPNSISKHSGGSAPNEANARATRWPVATSESIDHEAIENCICQLVPRGGHLYGDEVSEVVARAAESGLIKRHRAAVAFKPCASRLAPVATLQSLGAANIRQALAERGHLGGC